ncbi:uncharacterized protein SPSC_00330 [Sporisorium scitamineum]|uniref:Effector family protein Eff1 n=1 Tax=Sporisorium scitamineum TaxID=49012 RepID=A0A140KM73_9BASI|nr:uncharacterized protein SPSC_00330 [Sporisorium scitamineum]
MKLAVISVGFVVFIRGIVAPRVPWADARLFEDLSELEGVSEVFRLPQDTGSASSSSAHRPYWHPNEADMQRSDSFNFGFGASSGAYHGQHSTDILPHDPAPQLISPYAPGQRWPKVEDPYDFPDTDYKHLSDVRKSPSPQQEYQYVHYDHQIQGKRVATNGDVVRGVIDSGCIVPTTGFSYQSDANVQPHFKNWVDKTLVGTTWNPKSNVPIQLSDKALEEFPQRMSYLFYRRRTVQVIAFGEQVYIMTHHKAPDEWEWLPNFVAFWKYKQDSTGNSMVAVAMYPMNRWPYDMLLTRAEVPSTSFQTVVTNQGPVMQRPSKNYQAPRVPSTWTWNRGR